MENIAAKNAERFIGFSDIYENSRPVMPTYPISIIMRYLGYKPDLVVDLGCGTGLSTVIWRGFCNKVIGIEPSDDMRKIAETKSDENVSFIKGYSHDTGIYGNSTDVVVCSQSFHWMEPSSTIAEINRILKSGGIFATVDCDWPPVSDWKIDNAYMKLFDKIHEIEITNPDIKDDFVRYDKNAHLANIKSSGIFRFAREIVLSNSEKCTVERLINLTLSQGSLQAVLKKAPRLLDDEVNAYKSLVSEVFSDKTFTVDFSYRMRIAVK
ncbi:MAG: class I SAM-dependent methyltransferase [Saccharofermentanales bacterium]